MNFTAFRSSGNWYKGNLHSHTVNSDGKLTPEQSVDLFKKNGYSFLCLTEHDLYTDYRSEFNTDTFIILPGIEASAYLLDPDCPGTALQVHHMNGILGPSEMQAAASAGVLAHNTHLEPVVRYGTWNALSEAMELSRKLRSHGCIVMYNHPVWSRTVPEDFMDAGGLWALEIYNYDTENECAQGYDTRDWDIMLQKNRRCYAAATDDNHNPSGFDDACGGFIFVQADFLTHDDILHSLLDGRFYSSSGPVIINWGITDRTVWVDCQACARVNFICGGPVSRGRTVLPVLPGGKVVHAEYLLHGDETYVRAECIDFGGKTAWTNAFFL